MRNAVRQAPNRDGKGLAAFALIELLLVIAIIAILAAILFPVFSQAREKARQATCASNLKQLSTAWLMYANDYDETVAPFSYGTAATRQYTIWGSIEKSG